MPSGRTHDRITWILTPPVLLATWRLEGQWPAAFAVAGAFLFAGLMFSGDLDLKSIQYRRWGPLRWLWKPYQWLIPHRSPLSHGILLGPAVRLLYLTVVVGVLSWAGLLAAHQYGGGPVPEKALASSLGTIKLGPREWFLLQHALAGLWLGGASHTLADWTGSAWKRMGRKGKRRRR